MNINWMGPVNNLGYGIASYNFIMELSKNHNVILYPVGIVDLENLQKPNVINEALKKRYKQEHR